MPGPDRRTLLAAGLAAIAGCAPPPSSPSGRGPTPTPTRVSSARPGAVPRTRVMSYNILSGTRTAADFRPAVVEADVRLANRIPVMADWINAAAPSIIGLQENEPLGGPVSRPLQLLGPLLPQYEQVLPDCNIPILIRSGEYTVGQSEVRLISTRLFHRYLAWVHLTHSETGAKLLMANTHLDPYQLPEPARARAAEVATIVEILTGLNPGFATPIVLTGDFNTRADELRSTYRKPLDLLVRAGFKDTAVGTRDTSEVRGAATLNSLGVRVRGEWRYRAVRWDGFRYDYVWVSESVAVNEWKVLTGPGVRWIDGWPYFANGPIPSDHCPVQATLTVTR